MRKIKKKFSLFVLAVLLLQLISPITSAFAASNLTAPVNLKYSLDGYDNVILNWDAVSGATQYRVYEVVGENKIYINQTKYNNSYISGVLEGTHYYGVSAVNSTGESVLSSPLIIDINYPDMQPPNGLSFNIVNGNDVSLKWNPVEFATAYKVYEIKNGQRELLATTAQISQSFINVLEGKHDYEITSYNAKFGESLAGTISVNVVYPEMLAPSNLSTYIDDINNVSLSWAKALYATSYNIYQVVDGKRKLVATTNTTNQYLSNLPEGELNFEVTSYSSKFGESREGSKTTAKIVYPQILPPDQIYSYFYNGNDLSLMWSSIKYADSYKVYQIEGGQKKLLATTQSRSYYLSNLPEGDYTFEIVSVSNRFGESVPKTYNVSVVYPDMQAPKVILLKDTYNSALIGWPDVPNANEYEVYELIKGVPTLIKTTKSNSHYVNNLEQGKHEYTVIAKSERFGSSPFSNVVAFDVAPVLEAPKANEPSVNGDSVNLSWDQVPDADKYNIYEVVNGERVLVGTTTDSNFKLETPEEQGTHEYQIVPVTADGTESIDYATVTVDIDKPSDVTPPVTTADTNLDWSKDDVKVTLNATDDLSGVKTTFYSIDLGEYVEGTSVVLDKEGVHTVSFFSVDNAGNVEKVKTVEVKVDKEAPQTVINTSAYWYNKDVQAELTATDNLSGVKATYYSVDGSEFKEGTSFPLEKEGVHTVSFYSVDKVGNVEAVRTVEVKIDKEAPKTTANTTGDWYSQGVAVELTAVDNLSGVHSTYYSVNGSDFQEGTSIVLDKEGVNKITFYSVDNAGNIEEKHSVEVKVDKTAPTTVSNVEDKWFTNDVNVELTATDDLSGVKATYYSINGSEFAEGTNFVLDKEGINTITFYSEDNAGNIEEKQTVEVKVDKTAPTTVSDVEDKWYTDTVNVELTATDELSGVKATYYSINGSEFAEGTSFVVDKEGINTIAFYSVDNAGNVEEKQTVEVKVDKTAPTTVSNVEDKWYKDGVNVELTATDNLSGVKATYYSINGSDFTEGTNLVLNQEGTNTITFYSVDNAGNVEESHTVEVKTDKTAPTTVSNVEDKWYTDTVNVGLTATDNLSGVKSTNYSIDGSEFAEGTGLAVEKEGIHTISFYSVDNAGNVEGTKTEAVKIDKTAPTIKVDFPTEYALGSSLELNYKATDNLSGIKETIVEVNGVKNTTGKITFNKPGDQTIRITAIDNAGLKTVVEKTVSVYIEATIEVTPKVINGNKGEFTVRATLPKGYSFANVDLSTVTINNVHALSGSKGLENQAKNGQFKFDREDFVWDEKEELLVFRAKVGGYLVKGSTTVEVINPQKKSCGNNSLFSLLF
ncbi:OmpL47-type beta-barrel domain-containing protein [Neobacillus rhizophilus]|uniref:Fibronectin type-III domain-containing protein n=1 Tax=Neobacillus rhizophilus TaxID=2833579 RepID=A0A942YWT5_9BACI|nr:hypothetical protein [Neobacillus rhizophilus]MBS4213031.1 hypothetical protein [Neobacillus rhizophilus]